MRQALAHQHIDARNQSIKQPGLSKYQQLDDVDIPATFFPALQFPKAKVL